MCGERVCVIHICIVKQRKCVCVLETRYEFYFLKS